MLSYLIGGSCGRPLWLIDRVYVKEDAMRTFWIVLLSVLMLSGCGQKPPIPTPPADPPAPEIETPAVPEEPTVPETATSRPEKTDVVFTVEGEEEIVPCTLIYRRGLLPLSPG